MVINNFNIYRPRRTFRPLEANPPSVIDSNTVLALAVALERFQTISGQIQIKKRRGSFQLVELLSQLCAQIRRRLYPASLGELARPLVSKAHNHYFQR